MLTEHSKKIVTKEKLKDIIEDLKSNDCVESCIDEDELYSMAQELYAKRITNEKDCIDMVQSLSLNLNRKCFCGKAAKIYFTKGKCNPYFSCSEHKLQNAFNKTAKNKND